MDLRVVSFNCKNAKTSLVEIYALCNSNDVILLQETWLARSEIDVLRSLHPDFCADGVSAFDDSALLVGRPHGGVAVMWRSTLTAHVSVLKIEREKRIMGICIDCGNAPYLFLNVYFPCDNSTDVNYDEFMNILSCAITTVDDHPSLVAYIVGDMNACTRRPSVFGRELRSTCDDNGLVISDVQLLGDDTFTFFSEAHQTVSWLDHCLSTPLAHQRITAMEVRYDVLSSDHFPLAMTDSLPMAPASEPAMRPSNLDLSAPSPCWDRASDQDRQLYSACTENELLAITLPTDALACTDVCCTDPLHRRALDNLNKDITNALLMAAQHAIPSRRRGSHRTVPGWNELVRDYHAAARLAFLVWVRDGKPRHGPTHQEMHSTRLRFKYALRECKRREDSIRADKLANDLLDKDCVTFWRDVKTQQSSKAPLPPSIDGNTGCEAIASMWADYYTELFNSIPTSPLKASVLETIERECANAVEAPRPFSPAIVSKVLAGLHNGKSAGPDGLCGEHLKHANARISVLLSMFFNAALTHGYLPSVFTYSLLIPVIKDKAGDPTSKSNYRPIALMSVLAKVLEKCILVVYSDFFLSTDHQFGFKAKHSTDLCIFSLKETVNLYLNSGTPVFTCFLDASKAFDKVCHFTLFSKLLARGLPILALRLIVFMYSTQCISVRWGHALSTSFTVANGVRQGGVLSPIFFSIYMDNLSVSLSSCFIGCYVSNVLCNHLFYADDIVLLCPSVQGLQHLINICQSYSLSHSITFNPTKSFCVSFLPPRFNVHVSSVLSLNNVPLVFKSSCKYLGVLMSDDFTDDNDLNRQLRAFYGRINYLCRNFIACSPNVKVMLFSSFCANVYSSHCWVNFKRATMSKLTVAFNNCFRRFMFYPRFCSASGMFVFNGTCSLQEILRKSVFNFRTRLFNSLNVIIRAILNCTLCSSQMWTNWNSILFTF